MAVTFYDASKNANAIERSLLVLINNEMVIAFIEATPLSRFTVILAQHLDATFSRATVPASS